MSLDERRFERLIEESQDLHSDAMRGVQRSLPDLQDLAADRRGTVPDPAHVAEFDAGRRRALRNIGVGTGAVALFGTALNTLLAAPAAADTPLDVQQLQTASSLERLAVNTYGVALKLDFIANGNAVVKKFAQTTMSQHDEHRAAFIAQTKALGGEEQNKPNPMFQKVVDAAAPALKTPKDVVDLAATLEKTATDTYLTDLTKFTDKKSIALMGSVMGVECQHLATLRAVAALLEGGAEELIAIPTDLAKLPAAAGSVAFPKAFEDTPEDYVAPPESGAVK